MHTRAHENVMKNTSTPCFWSFIELSLQKVYDRNFEKIVGKIKIAPLQDMSDISNSLIGVIYTKQPENVSTLSMNKNKHCRDEKKKRMM